MIPPIKAMISLFHNLKPILFSMSELKGIVQTFGKPEIREIDVAGKKKFVVVEKTAFDSKKDAESYIDIGNRVHSMKF